MILQIRWVPVAYKHGYTASRVDNWQSYGTIKRCKEIAHSQLTSLQASELNLPYNSIYSIQISGGNIFYKLYYDQ